MKMKSLILMIAGALLLVFTTAAQANPANKDVVSAAGSMETAAIGPTCDTPGPPFICEDDSGWFTLLSGTIKAKNNGAYMVSLTMECFTGSYDVDSLIPYGFGIDYRRASVQVRVRFDGMALYDTGGTVVMCGDETFQLYASFADIGGCDAPWCYDLDVQLNRFGGAHAFSWPVLNIPHGEYDVVVEGRLRARVLGIDSIPDEGTIAGIGKRTLHIQPIHPPQGAELGCVGFGC